MSKKKAKRTALRRRNRADRESAVERGTILEALNAARAPLTADELAARLHVPRHARREFDRALGELERSGEVVKNRAGALLVAKRIALVAPYMKPLTQMVVGYIAKEGIEVADWLALEIPDNLEVAAQDPAKLLDHYKRLDLGGIDALVLSACVQMPSLPSVQKIEDAIGKPVVSAAICTAHQMLTRLGLSTGVPGAGALLSGHY